MGTTSWPDAAVSIVFIVAFAAVLIAFVRS